MSTSVTGFAGKPAYILRVCVCVCDHGKEARERDDKGSLSKAFYAGESCPMCKIFGRRRY